MQDLRYAFKMLRKRPAFTITAIVVLALGIGANSAVFSVVNALLVRPLVLPQLDRLVEVRDVTPGQPREAVGVTPADYLDWKARANSFQSISAYGFHDFGLASEGGEPIGVRGAQVTADFLRTLGTAPRLGRGFEAGEDQPGRAQVAVLTDALWRNRFAADASVVGRTIQLDAQPFTVIGVMPPEFEFPFSGAAVLTPLTWSPARRNDRRGYGVLTVARLRDGVSLARARSEMSAQALRLAREYPETNAGRGAGVVLLRERQGEFSKPFLLLMQATAIFVLLIACANLANLQLAQAVARQREIAIRTALGAGRRRVLRLLIVESVLLAVIGGVEGIGVAYLGVAALKAGVPPDGSRNIMGWSQVAVDPSVLLFTLAVAAGAGIVFGLSSAVQASRADLAVLIKQGGAQSGSKSRLRNLLVVGEVTLAVVAVMGAGQMVRGFQAMFDAYQGFSPDRILAAWLVLPTEGYDSPHRVAALFDGAQAAAAGLPGVEAATVTSNLPGALHFNLHTEVEIEGKPALSHAEAVRADFQFAGPQFFEALRIPLLQGRAIAEQDGADAPAAVVLSQRAAATLFPGQDPLGKRIRFDDAGAHAWRTVVGVAGNIHQFWFEKDARSLVYVPYRQVPRRSMFLAVRTHGDPMAVLPAIRERMHRLDPSLPVREPRLMRDVMLETLAAMQLTTSMMMTFGVLALVLAAVGIYGVMAYSVTQRYREFGIRMALGAAPGTVRRMVVRQGLAVACWGLALGIAGGFGLSRAMGGIMFGVGGDSAAMLAGVPCLLALVCLLACWIPARVVTAVDPVTALRTD